MVDVAKMASAQRRLAADYDVSYRECRDIGHKWAENTMEIQGSELHRTLRCICCTAERHEAFSKSGELLYRRYYHAENYLLPTNDGELRYSKQFWRGLQYIVAKQKQASNV